MFQEKKIRINKSTTNVLHVTHFNRHYKYWGIDEMTQMHHDWTNNVQNTIDFNTSRIGEFIK